MNYYARGGQALGLKALAQELQNKGRNGDTILAHINPQEARMLKAAGGSGTINPATGLPEFGLFGIGGGGGILGTGINKNAKDPVSNALSNNPISQGISKGFQGAMGAVDQGLVGLDKFVGKTIPGGWGTLGMAAASFIPGMTPMMMGGLGALNGSGVLRRGGNFNLQGAMMGGAVAYGMSSLTQGLEAAGGGGADAVANAAGVNAPGAATAEGIASQIANQTGSAVSAAPGSQAAMLAAQVADMGVAGANNIASALTAPTTGVGIGSQVMAGNFGNAMNQVGQNISGGFNNAVASGQNLLDKATTGSTYENLAKGYGKNVAAAGRGIANLSGLGEGTAEAAKAFAGSGATMSNTLVPIAVGVTGLAAIDEQRKYLQDQANAGAISNAEYNSALADIERQADIARKAVLANPLQVNPGTDGLSEDPTLYRRSDSNETLYDKNPYEGATLYATGGAVNTPDDQTKMLGGSPMTNFMPNSNQLASFLSNANIPRFGDQDAAANPFTGGRGLMNSIGANLPQPSTAGTTTVTRDQFGQPNVEFNQSTGQMGMGGQTNPIQAQQDMAARSAMQGGMGGMQPNLAPTSFGQSLQSGFGQGASGYPSFNMGSSGGGSGGAFPLQGQYGIVKMAAGGMPRFLSGGGDGMSDSIKANIEGTQEARLADGEFVIPADVVSHLGNGSSKAGAKQLYSMMDKVRQARVGNKKQGKQINPRKYLAV